MLKDTWHGEQRRLRNKYEKAHRNMMRAKSRRVHKKWARLSIRYHLKLLQLGLLNFNQLMDDAYSLYDKTYGE